MSNLVSDHYDYSSDPRCKCRPVHGNADTDGICKHCRPKVEAAQEAREEALGAALHAFFSQVARVPDDYLFGVLEGLVTAVTESVGDYSNPSDRCLLCRGADGCKPGCAVLRIQELIG